MCINIEIGSENMTPINISHSELKNQIEILREEMVTIGFSKGLCSEETIKISQKLDHYITIYISIINHMHGKSISQVYQNFDIL